jgi:SAM-dependent methyltransferase
MPFYFAALFCHNMPMAESDEITMAAADFSRERKRARRFFDLTATVYPLIERHLFPRYQRALERLDLPRQLPVLDVGTGSGILAAAFAGRGHAVQGLDFSPRLLRRARNRFPQVDFRAFDLVDLPQLPDRGFAIVSCGYLLHGLSPDFRGRVLEQLARIASFRVLVFDYDKGGGFLVRLIERIEGPHYRQYIAVERAAEFARAGLALETTFLTSGFGRVWLCRPEPIACLKG